MAIDNDWLLENLSGSYSLGAVDDAVDSLIGEYDSFIDKINEDKRNYMMEAVSTMKEKIITSRVENVLELIDSTQFTDGDEFRTIGNSLSIIATKYTDGESDASAWTIKKISQEMDNSFEPITKVETAAVQDGYSGAANVISKKDLASSNNALPKSANEVVVPFAEVESASLSNPNSVLNVSQFIERYIPSSYEKEIDVVKLTIDTSLKNIKLSVSEASFIEQAITDAELKGSGSKLSDYTEVTAGTEASSYKDTINVILNYGDTYTVTVGGTNYQYTANGDDTAEDIASGLSDELGNDTDLSVSQDAGFWSTVFENGNGDKVFGWYAENTDDSLSYEVQMVVPTDSHDLTIEQDADNPEKIIITFEHDGSDVVYPTIGDIRDLVNSFEDVDTRVVVMPGFDPDEEYDTADNVTLDIGDSCIVIEASSEQTISTDGPDTKMLYTHISDYTAASTQVGTFEVIKFNPSDTYYVDINGNKANVDPSADGNESVVDEPSLAERFATLINNGAYDATASYSGNTVTLTAKNSGDSFPVSTSGENNYAEPIERETLLRYDVRNLPNVNAATILQLKKSGTVITDNNEPLNKTDVSRLSTSGIVFSDSYMMLPQVPDIVDSTNSFVPKISRTALSLEKTISKEKSKISTADNLVSPVIRSMPKLLFPLYSTEQAKSNRWFFVEAGANSVAAKPTIGVAMSTISPKDYERLVLQDTNATFSSTLASRLPNVGQSFESLTSLITEKVQSYNASGKKATIRLPLDAYKPKTMDIINDFLTEKQIDGFIKYALLPQIVSGSDFMDIDSAISDAKDILITNGQVVTYTNVTQSYKIELYIEDTTANIYDLKELFDNSKFTVVSVDRTPYYTDTVPVSTDKIEHPSTRIVIKEKIADDFIIAQDATELYKSLMELAIQIDDSLREQRFIALAGSYVIDASDLIELYSDELFADYVFGVNEAEVAPENNYGIGGVPIDATVTMSKLYFRNMRNQALMKPLKPFALGNEIPIEKLFAHMVPTLYIKNITPADGESWSVVDTNNDVHVEGDSSDTYEPYFIYLPESTPVEDKLFDEIARTGYFSSNVDRGINHSPTGISIRHVDSIWNLLMDAIEINDDGEIISINSARSYIQSLYQSFNAMSEIQFSMLLLKNNAYFDIQDDKRDNIYSPIVTLFLKILLYLKEKKSDIDYSSWKSTFDNIVGRIFVDDEEATNILPYEIFLSWVAGIGAHKAFSWSGDIEKDTTNYFSGLNADIFTSSKIKGVINSETEKTVNASLYTISWSMETVSDALVPSVTIKTT